MYFNANYNCLLATTVGIQVFFGRVSPPANVQAGKDDNQVVKEQDSGEFHWGKLETLPWKTSGMSTETSAIHGHSM